MIGILIGFGVALAAAGGWAYSRRRGGRNGIEAHQSTHDVHRPSGESYSAGAPQTWIDNGL